MINVNIKIEGLEGLTESLALIGSALAYKNDMIKTSYAATNLILDITDKVEDLTEEEEIKKDVVEKVIPEVVKKEDKKAKKEEVKETEEVGQKITIEEVREVFVSKNKTKEDPAKLKAILEKYGANKVTALEEKDFAAVLKDLEEM